MRPGRLLAVLLAGQFMANVDSAVVNIAMPSLQADLGATGGEVALVVSGYTLAYAMLLITGARLGDMRGYRRMFLLGLLAFTIASLACGLAPDAVTLIVARIVQGVGAALMVPQVLSGIQLHFSGAGRARALGYYAAALSGGAVAGQVLGGVLISADLLGTGWRPVFLVNVPVGAALLVAGLRFLPADGRSAPQRLDLLGVALLSGTLLAAVLPLVLGRDHGWPAWMWVSLGASLPAFVAFVAWERRVGARGRYPLVNLGVATRPAVAWGLAAFAASTATYFSLLFCLALFLQQGLGETPLYSGLALVSWVAAFGIAGPVLPRLPDAIRGLAAPIGCLGLAGVYLTVSATRAEGAVLLALLGVGGLGLGMSFRGLVGHLTEAVPTRFAPDISGLIATVAQLSGVAGVATFGTAYLALAPDPGRDAAMDAFAVVTAAFAVTALAAAGAAWRATRGAAERREPVAARA